MDIQPGGVQDHFLQNVLKFGLDKYIWNEEAQPHFPKISRKLDVRIGKMKKKSISKERKTSICFNKLAVYYQGSLHINKIFRV